MQTIDGRFCGAPPLWECIYCIHFEYKQTPELAYLELGMGSPCMLKNQSVWVKTVTHEAVQDVFFFPPKFGNFQQSQRDREKVFAITPLNE